MPHDYCYTSNLHHYGFYIIILYIIISTLEIDSVIEMLCGSVVPLTLLVLVLLNPALCDGRDASFLLVTSSSVDFNTTDVIDSVQLAVDEVLKESLLRGLRYYVMEAEVCVLYYLPTLT